ncbi:MAG TPA: O-antigen polymerase [Bacteroidota bacterium]|nr:O-antigen polymerase [Bacteroidota bacterium]
MNLVSIIFFLICAGIVLSCLKRGADVLSPARVFGFVWALSFGLAELKMSGLQHEWSTESWIILLLGPLSFLLGLFALYVMNLNSQLLSLDEIRSRCRLSRVDNNRLFGVTLVFFFLFVVAYAAIVLTGHEIPLLSSRPGLARAKFQMFGIGLLIHNLTEVGFFATLYFVLVGHEKGRKGILAFATIVCFLMYAITLQRFPLAVTALMMVTLVHYMTRHLRARVTAFYLGVGVVFLLAISRLRASAIFVYFVYVGSKMRIDPSFAWVTEPYMYFVMNLEMFARSVDRLEEFTYGYYTFDFVTALTGLKHWLSDYFGLVETPFLISGYNTYSAFWTYYRDFGVLGVFLISLIGGVVVGSLYYSLRQAPRLSTLSAYGVAVFLMALSVFNSQFGFLWFVYNVVLLFVTLRWIERPSGAAVQDGTEGVAAHTI